MTEYEKTMKSYYKFIEDGFEVIYPQDVKPEWVTENDCIRDYGEIQGYVRGYCYECIKDGKLDYCSTTFIHTTIEEEAKRELDNYGCIIYGEII